MSSRGSGEDSPKGEQKQQITRAGTVALVGRPNVGKSTLMNALLGEALAIVSSTPQTTRDRMLGVIQHENAQIGLLDTPGLHKPKTQLGRMMNTAARDSASTADVVLFLMDVDLKRSPLEMREEDKELLSEIGKDRPVVLVINKIDLIHPKNLLLPLLEKIGQVRDFSAIIPLSALRGGGLKQLLSEIVPMLPEGEPLFEEDMLTDKPIRFFAAEFVREQILLVTRAEVPYASAVSIESFQEGVPVTRIEATIHVEREGQKIIIVGKGGSRIKEIGIAARERIERLIGKRVHLALFVRVTPGWSENAKMLNELGYNPAQGNES
jgi:GTPase